MWRPKASSDSESLTFEQKKQNAENEALSLTSAVASAGAFLGGWLPGLGSSSQPEKT